MTLQKILLTFGGLAFSTTLIAQVPVTVPSQLHSKSLFLASGAAYGLEASNVLYTAMYQGLVKENYKLASTPDEAELNAEIALATVAGPTFQGSSEVSRSVRLTIHDRKTQAVLWVVEAPVPNANRKATYLKNLQTATNEVIDDLIALRSGKLPEVPNDK